MIDIQKLKQFPLGFKAFEQYIEQKLGSVLFIYNGSGVVRNEDIIDFLDKYYIFICPMLFNSEFEWGYKITSYFDVDFKVKTDGIFQTRTIAIESGIKEAFDLLENKLEQN